MSASEARERRVAQPQDGEQHHLAKRLEGRSLAT
jgi:hypothetical protein